MTEVKGLEAEEQCEYPNQTTVVIRNDSLRMKTMKLLFQSGPFLDNAEVRVLMMKMKFLKYIDIEHSQY